MGKKSWRKDREEGIETKERRTIGRGEGHTGI